MACPFRSGKTTSYFATAVHLILPKVANRTGRPDRRFGRGGDLAAVLADQRPKPAGETGGLPWLGASALAGGGSAPPAPVTEDGFGFSPFAAVSPAAWRSSPPFVMMMMMMVVMVVMVLFHLLGWGWHRVLLFLRKGRNGEAKRNEGRQGNSKLLHGIPPGSRPTTDNL
jgi:hypothetical protein